jgi:intein/homing endonuclease
MAYVLGYLYADGSLEDASYLRGKYIRVTSTDKESILRIKKLLGSAHTVVILSPTGAHGKERYFLRIGNKKIYEQLTQFGLHPNKSKTITMPVIPKKFLSDFVRGYFDGDGCVYLEKNPSNKNLYKRMRVIFTSGSRGFLTTLSQVIEKQTGISGDVLRGYNNAFQLRYNTRNSTMISDFMYARANGVYLERKAHKFEDFLERRGRS